MNLGIFHYFFCFILAGSIAFLLTPVVRKLALKFHVIDLPNERKLHDSAIPTMGGIAMYVAFFATVYAVSLGHILWFQESPFVHFKIDRLLIGSTFLVLIGMLDDKYRVNYKWKLMVQIGVALLMLYFGYRIDGITNPLNGTTIPLGFLSVPVTMFWFLFIINAINFMDGIDGLAAGVSLIALLTIFVVSLYLGNVQVAVLSVSLAGSIVGFLRYNFHPASIFMGDTGSLFLGFLISLLSLRGAQKSSTVVALAIPIVTLGLPIMDAVVAVIRRWSTGWTISHSLLDRLFAFRKIFSPDLNHIHHRLLAYGFTKREVAIFLYLVAIGFGISGFILTAVRYQYIALILLYMGVVFFIAFRKFPAFRTLIPPTEPTAGSNPVAHEGCFKSPDMPQGFGLRGKFRRLVIWTVGVILPMLFVLILIIGRTCFR